MSFRILYIKGNEAVFLEPFLFFLLALVNPYIQFEDYSSPCRNSGQEFFTLFCIMNEEMQHFYKKEIPVNCKRMLKRQLKLGEQE